MNKFLELLTRKTFKIILIVVSALFITLNLISAFNCPENTECSSGFHLVFAAAWTGILVISIISLRRESNENISEHNKDGEPPS